jgi:hypothetical protein
MMEVKTSLVVSASIVCSRPGREVLPDACRVFAQGASPLVASDRGSASVDTHDSMDHPQLQQPRLALGSGLTTRDPGATSNSSNCRPMPEYTVGKSETLLYPTRLPLLENQGRGIALATSKDLRNRGLS